MPNKTLTAKVRIDTQKATTSLDKLMKKIKTINDFVNKNTNAKGIDKQLEKTILQSEKIRKKTADREYAEERVKTQVAKTNNELTKGDILQGKLLQQTNSIANRVREWQTAQKDIQSSARLTNNVFSSIGRTLRNLAATYLGIMGIRATATTSDIITSAENRLNNLEGGNARQTAETMDKIYGASQRARSGYTEMMANVSKTMTLAGDAFGGSIDNAIRFQEIMSKSYTIGGASAAEQASSMYQLVQALGSGILQGDELRSVREGAPIAYKEIEKFAQGVLGADESLKELAADGLITSEMVVAAIMNAEEKIEKSFKNTKMTFAQAFTNIKNVAIKAFEPLLQKMNDILNSSVGRRIIEGIGNALVFTANAISELMDIIGSFFTWFGENWGWLQWIVYTVLTSFLIYQGIVLAKMTQTAVKAMVAFAANNPWLLWVIGIMALAGAMHWLYENAQWIFWGILGIALLTALLFGNWWLFAIVGVAALLAMFVSDFRGTLEMICGFVFATGAFVYNFVVGLIDGIIEAFFNIFVNPIAGIIEWLVNAFCGGFDNILLAGLNFVGQLLSIIVGVFKPLAKLLDKAFGWDTNSMLASAQNGLKSWGKNSNAVTFGIDAPSIGKRLDLTDSYYNGKRFGGQLVSKLNSIKTDPRALGLDDQNALANRSSSNGLPNPYDPGLALDPYNAGDLLDGIKGDTGSIADSMELTQEDLEFLRRIADMEWKKEYTTAEIKVDMTNYNQVNGDTDLDGLVTKLTDKLNEELNVVANGVYVY